MLGMQLIKAGFSDATQKPLKNQFEITCLITKKKKKNCDMLLGASQF